MAVAVVIVSAKGCRLRVVFIDAIEPSLGEHAFVHRPSSQCTTRAWTNVRIRHEKKAQGLELALLEADAAE